MQKQKIDISFYLAFHDLMALQNLVIYDIEYQQRLKSLIDYVSKKIEIPDNFDICETYVVQLLEKVR